jgi:hypothetical protein
MRKRQSEAEADQDNPARKLHVLPVNLWPLSRFGTGSGLCASEAESTEALRLS